MAPHKTAIVPTPVTVGLESGGHVTYGNHATRLHPDGSVSVDFYDRSQPGQDRKTGELRAWFERADGHPSKISLENSAGLPASALQRFPWARWLTVADAAKAALQEDNPYSSAYDRLGEISWQAMKGERLTRFAKVDRPGRGGHPGTFYQDVAARYRELRLDGCRNPTTTIAKERGYSPATVAGWVHKARERGYLKKVRPGKAGG